ncbi:unnamed protein product [Eretmochelys imbricata]
MAEELPPSLFFQHQYMCSECGLLYNTLEEVLIHQQSHLGEPCQPPGAAPAVALGAGPLQESRYQCLECGRVLLSPDALLAHQSLHPRQEPARPPPPASAGQIHYQCSECKELFAAPDLWLAHRQSHKAQEPVAAPTAAAPAPAGPPADHAPLRVLGVRRPLPDARGAAGAPGRALHRDGEGERGAGCARGGQTGGPQLSRPLAAAANAGPSAGLALRRVPAGVRPGGGAAAPPPGARPRGVPVRRVPARLHHGQPAAGAPAGARGRHARVPQLQQGLQEGGLAGAAHAGPQGRGPVPVRRLRAGLRHRDDAGGPPQEPHGQPPCTAAPAARPSAT